MPCDPQVAEFDLYGRRILFDANSLAAIEAPFPSPPSHASASSPPPFSGILYSRAAPQFPLRPGAVRKVTLLVTTCCNLRCRYCFVRLSPPSPPSHLSVLDMSADVAAQALALLPGDVDLAFFGGEPLLAWDRVVQVAALARARSPAAKLHLTTNATLLDDERAVWLKAHGFSVLVSLDGPPEIHNANRPGLSGDSYDATMLGLRALQCAGLRPYLRATFDDPDTDLAALLAFFSELCDLKLASGVSIEPAVLAEGCGTSPARFFNPCALSVLAVRYHEAAIWYVAQVRLGRPFDFAPFRKILKRLLYTEHMPAECGAGVGYVTVGPDGTIFACHKAGPCAIGDVAHGIDEARRALWADNRYYVRDGCLGCWARHLCGGGCRHHRLVLAGGVNARAPVLCALRQMLIRESLWILAELGPDLCRSFVR